MYTHAYTHTNTHTRLDINYIVYVYMLSVNGVYDGAIEGDYKCSLRHKAERNKTGWEQGESLKLSKI